LLRDTGGFKHVDAPKRRKYAVSLAQAIDSLFDFSSNSCRPDFLTGDGFAIIALLTKNATFALHATGAVKSGLMIALQPPGEALLLICCRCSNVPFLLNL
jgi:hypothetical protein